MKRVLLVVVFLTCTLASQCQADFSYRFSLPGHSNIIVTALGNGKTFLRLDGLLHQSRDNILHMDAEDNYFCLYRGGRVLSVDLTNGIFFKISVLSPAAESRWSKYSTSMELNGKSILVEKGSVGDLDSPDTYLFNYRFRSNSNHRMFEVTQMSMMNEIPDEFQTALITFTERRIAR